MKTSTELKTTVPLTIVCRSSPLARIQNDEALEALKSVHGVIPPVQTVYLESLGDKDKNLSLLEGQAPADFFTRELDQALVRGQADFAVHSAKDLPVPLGAEFELYALLPGQDPRDALVFSPAFLDRHPEVAASLGNEGELFRLLPPGTRIGTSSPLRKAQLLDRNPHLAIVSIRGTIHERIALTEGEKADAVVVALCALKRLGLNPPQAILSFETHPLQGHLAVTGLRRRRDLADLWAPLDIRRSWGRAVLAGAGPGDPELVSPRTLRAIRNADIIFYDALLPSGLIPPEKEAVFVGKRKGEHSQTQDEINRLLETAVKAGKITLRLKGGDPFVFGRGGEEYRYLTERLVSVEVIPGISSAMAAAAGTGFSLTDREAGATVALCTGFPAERIQVPDTDTRVYFMGTTNQALIAQKHLDAGQSPDEPALLVSGASLFDQKTRFTTLGALATPTPDKEASDGRIPQLLITGSAVPRHPVPAWAEQRKKVWYTGIDPESLERQACYRHFLSPAVLHVPLIRTRALDPASDPQEFADLQQSLKDELEAARQAPEDLGPWLILTSRPAVEYFFLALEVLKKDSRALAGFQIAAVGRSTAARLAEHGLRADFIPADESGKGLARELTQVLRGPRRAFLPCSELALPHLTRILTENGWTVHRQTLYKNEETQPDPLPVLDDLDEVFLTSPSTVRAFRRLYPGSLPDHLVLRVMGEETASAAAETWPGRIKRSRE